MPSVSEEEAGPGGSPPLSDNEEEAGESPVPSENEEEADPGRSPKTSDRESSYDDRPRPPNTPNYELPDLLGIGGNCKSLHTCIRRCLYLILA